MNYTIISASNRTDNKTKVFANSCRLALEDQGVSVQIFNLEEFLPLLSNADMYDFDNSPISEIVEKYFRDVDKLLFVLPEYNGSFPGVLKLFIDSVHPKEFKGKKAALVGISSGRAGNARGLDHFTSILHHLGVNVYCHALSIGTIDPMITDNKVSNPTEEGRINKLINEFIAY